MNEPMLSAGQVAAMTLRVAQVDGDLRPSPHSLLGKVLQQDAPALVAQDRRWRALVGALLAYGDHQDTCALVSIADGPACTCGLDGWIAQAQAALDTELE